MDDDAYRTAWQEAQQEAARRLDEHTRTMIVMLEKQVKALHQRCEECWTIANKQRATIGGLIAAIDEIKASIATDKETLKQQLQKRFKDVESKIGDGRLGD